MFPNKSMELISLIPNKHPHIYQVQLNLEHQTRYIGKIDTAGEGTFITSRSEKHLFRKTNSLGLNYALLTDARIKFNKILITYNGKKYYSSREYFLKKGKIFQFSNKSFELQVFVRLEDLNLNSVKRFEQFYGHQESLFGNVA